MNFSQLIIEIKKLPAHTVTNMVYNNAIMNSPDDVIKYFFLVARFAQIKKQSYHQMFDEFKSVINKNDFGLNVLIPELTDLNQRQITCFLVNEKNQVITSTDEMGMRVRKHRKNQSHFDQPPITNNPYDDLKKTDDIPNLNITNIQIQDDFKHPLPLNGSESQSVQFDTKNPNSKNKRKQIDEPYKWIHENSFNMDNEQYQGYYEKKHKKNSELPKQQVITPQVNGDSTNTPIAQAQENHFYRNPLTSQQLLFGNAPKPPTTPQLFEKRVLVEEQELEQDLSPIAQENETVNDFYELSTFSEENEDTDSNFYFLSKFFG